MIVAFDSSVLVAALVAGHPRHVAARPVLDACADGERSGVASWHALAETWSVLTRLPATPVVSPEQARTAVAQLRELLQLIAPTDEIYGRALDRCASRGLRSGVVFDAIHVVTAELAGADELVTFNPRDFERLTSGDEPAIVVPR